MLDDALHYLRSRNLPRNPSTEEFPRLHKVNSSLTDVNLIVSNGSLTSIDCINSNGCAPPTIRPMLLVWSAANEQALTR